MKNDGKTYSFDLGRRRFHERYNNLWVFGDHKCMNNAIGMCLIFAYIDTL